MRSMLALFVSLLICCSGVHAEEVDLLIQSQDEPIAGTLVLPERPLPPLVIMISGSGAQERDSDVFGFPLFERLAEELRKAGIASFRYDDRGTGRSGGVYDEATMDRLAADVAIVVDHFKVFSDRRFSEIILYGHSQGGIIAGRIAALDNRINRVILAASSGMNMRRILRQQVTEAYLQNQLSPELIEEEVSAREQIMFAIADEEDVNAARDAYARTYRRVLEELPREVRNEISDLDTYAEQQADQLVAAFSSPLTQSLIFHDPTLDLTGVDVPVLMLFGQRDTQVREPDNRPLMEAALDQAGSQFQVSVIEDANHLFQRAQTGDVSEYAALDKAFVPEFVSSITQWVNRRQEAGDGP